MSKYPQTVFNAELENTLKKANARNESRMRIVAGEFHDSVVAPEDSYKKNSNHRMSIACIAMFRLALYQRGKAKHIGKLPNGATPTLTIEFDTADLPE